jgi:rhamnose transport system permease protein
MTIVPSTMPLRPDAATDAPDLHVAPQQVILALVLLFEVAVFGLVGENFLSAENLLTVLRQNAELGLLALALTPVILTGGIDLSVGSLMGLSAVVFGMLCRDANLSPASAAGVTLLVATLCGGLNAAARHPRPDPAADRHARHVLALSGVAEGITGGQGATSTSRPASFGSATGSLLGLRPALGASAAAAAFYLLVHRSTVGRALSAIGFAPDGARYAAIRVERLTGLAYVSAGFCAGLAALIYVARFGQAKADAATGYELQAITAVVLGGTSIFGGRASVAGTLLGLLAVALLENGQALAGYKRELTGILVGVLLLSAVGLDFSRLRASRRTARATSSTTGGQEPEELDMRNSQLAVLCAVIIAAALIITGGNFALVNALKKEAAASARAGGPNAAGGANADPANGRKLVVAMMPKSKGNAYFIACQKGAEEAAKELGVEFLWDGPTSADPAEQNKIVETWITRKVDVIAVAVENAGGLSTALRKARDAGIKVVTWDADASQDARDFFCNQATPDGIGDTMMETAAR